jgi:carbonic anhydrase/acetyltransferase-like protein (isoleucine patch superfamily)
MIIPHHGCQPEIDDSVFVAPSADVIGEVNIGAHSSVWFQSVIRGDVNSIKIGEYTNIQDHSMLHVTRTGDRGADLVIGDHVTIGHRVLLHGCSIGNQCLIGMGSVIMDNAEISECSIVGAGALVTEGKTFPPRSLIIGSPAKAVRELSPEEVSFLKSHAENYAKDGAEYKEMNLGKN